jgi:hypothetical protein
MNWYDILIFEGPQLVVGHRLQRLVGILSQVLLKHITCGKSVAHEPIMRTRKVMTRRAQDAVLMAQDKTQRSRCISALAGMEGVLVPGVPGDPVTVPVTRREFSLKTLRVLCVALNR